jgi:O-antigen ligase
MIVVLVGILLLILALVFRPQTTFAVIVALLVLAYARFLEGLLLSTSGVNVYVLDPILVALAVYLVGSLTWKSQSSVTRPASFRLFLLFFAWGIWSIVRNLPQYGVSAVGEGRYLLFPILFYFFILSVYRNATRLSGLLKWSVALVCLLPVTNFIAFYLLGGQLPFLENVVDNDILFAQAQFRFVNAGESIVVALVALGLFIFSQGGERQWRGRFLVLCGLLSLVILVTQIRSVWLALALGLLLTPLVTRRFPTRILLMAGVAVLSAILMLVLFDLQDSSFITSLANSAAFLTDPSADQTGSMRLFIWQQAWDQAMQNPMLGDGLGGYNHNVDPQGRVLNIPLHNGYLTLLVKFGAVGCLLMLAGLGAWLIELVRFVRSECKRYYRLLGGTMAIGTVMFGVYAFFFDFTIPFWILLGLGTSLVSIRRAQPWAILSAPMDQPITSVSGPKYARRISIARERSLGDTH